MKTENNSSLTISRVHKKICAINKIKSTNFTLNITISLDQLCMVICHKIIQVEWFCIGALVLSLKLLIQPTCG